MSVDYCNPARDVRNKVSKMPVVDGCWILTDHDSNRMADTVVELFAIRHAFLVNLNAYYTDALDQISLQVAQLTSEEGVADVFHGTLVAGTVGTPYIPSQQGLYLPNIPNTYPIVGEDELWPCAKIDIVSDAVLKSTQSTQCETAQV